MGFSSGNMERKMHSVTAPHFNSTEKVHGLIKDIAGHAWRGRGDMIDRVYDAIHSAFPQSPWTRRRVRAFWHREAARIDWREVCELEFVAEVERVRRLKAEATRADHHDFLRHISTTLDRLEAGDADFHREHRAALCALAFGSSDQESRSASVEGDICSASSRRAFGSSDAVISE